MLLPTSDAVMPTSNVLLHYFRLMFADRLRLTSYFRLPYCPTVLLPYFPSSLRPSSYFLNRIHLCLFLFRTGYSPTSDLLDIDLLP